MPKPSSPRPINGRESALTSSLRSYASKKIRKNGNSHFSGSEGHDLQGTSFESGRSVETPKFMSKTIDFQPRNKNQKTLTDMLRKDGPPIVIACGSSGSGKTHCSLVVALRQLQEGSIKRIVLTRPAVSVDEEHGFLPGSLLEKLEPWLLPLYEIMEEFYTPKQIKDMIDEKLIVIAPLSYIRGRTFNDCVVIAEEMQNATKLQTLSLLTRLGKNSTINLTGDLAQSDLKSKTNGLKDLIERVGDGIPGEIEIVKFEDDDVVRHPVIKTILKLYKDDDSPATFMDRA